MCVVVDTKGTRVAVPERGKAWWGEASSQMNKKRDPRRAEGQVVNDHLQPPKPRESGGKWGWGWGWGKGSGGCLDHHHPLTVAREGGGG